MVRFVTKRQPVLVNNYSLLNVTSLFILKPKFISYSKIVYTMPFCVSGV